MRKMLINVLGAAIVAAMALPSGAATQGFATDAKGPRCTEFGGTVANNGFQVTGVMEIPAGTCGSYEYRMSLIDSTGAEEAFDAKSGIDGANELRFAIDLAVPFSTACVRATVTHLVSGRVADVYPNDGSCDPIPFEPNPPGKSWG